MSLALITAVHAMKCQQEGRKTGGFHDSFNHRGLLTYICSSLRLYRF